MVDDNYIIKYIRSTESGRFLSPSGEWVSDLNEAWAFSDPLEVIRVKNALELAHVELFYAADSEPQNPSRNFAIRLE
jgi:hypothetical protein